MNVGKQFEQDFKSSVPESVMYYRLPDAATSFGGDNSLRFSRKNPCDSFLFYPTSRTFFALELKSVGGGSISFEKSKEEKGIIHFHQAEGLRKFGSFDGIMAGFVLNFRKEDKTYFIEIGNYLKMIDVIGKKSFNEKDLLQYNPILISQQKKRVHWKYNIEKFLQDTSTN